MSQRNSFKNYKIEFKNAAKKDLKKLEKSVADKIRDTLLKLISGEPNVDVIKMQGIVELYRIRSGKFRIVFEAHKHIITILVVSIGPRKDIYKDF